VTIQERKRVRIYHLIELITSKNVYFICGVWTRSLHLHKSWCYECNVNKQLTAVSKGYTSLLVCASLALCSVLLMSSLSRISSEAKKRIFFTFCHIMDSIVTVFLLTSIDIDYWFHSLSLFGEANDHSSREQDSLQPLRSDDYFQQKLNYFFS
jgi:hypothetical protein